MSFATVGALSTGCYSLQPAGGVNFAPGTRVAFDISDAGRIALGGSMGPDIDQIEGRLIDKTPDDYLVAVSAVKLLRGGVQVWSGERVRLRPEYVSRTYERRFDKGRTVALGATIVGGVATLVLTRDLLGIGGGDAEPGPPIDTSNTFRPRRRP